MIELSLEGKGFDGRTLLGTISLSLQAGELVCLLGPSGCGKTTLLNLLAGLDTGFSGSLSCSHRRISYMFQEPRLLPWRTVRQNLELVAGDNPSAGIDPLLALMDLTEVADRFPSRLSLGMARRVALARTLLNDPDLILMDEPFVSLDPPTAAELGAMLGRLRQQRPEVAILMVTHDVREAIELADRILVLGGSPTRILRESVPSREGREQQERLLLDSYCRRNAQERSDSEDRGKPGGGHQTAAQCAGNSRQPA